MDEMEPGGIAKSALHETKQTSSDVSTSSVNELAAEKLQLEIKRLERPWYKDIELLVKAFSVPLGIGGLVAGIYFSSLQQRVEKLGAQEALLKASVEAKSAENQRLDAERLDLQDSVSELRERLADEAFRTRMDLLTDASDGRRGQSASGILPRPAVDIIAMLRDDAVRRPRNLATLEQTLTDANDAYLRAMLLTILWQGSRDQKWVRAIYDELRRFVDPESDPPMQNALSLSFWESLILFDIPSQTRVSFGRGLISGLGLNLASRNPLPARRQVLVLEVVFGQLLPSSAEVLDESTLDPFVNGMAIARRLAKDPDNQREERILALGVLRSLSREALLVTVAELLAEKETDGNMRDSLEEFEISFPRDLKWPRSSDVEDWQEWVDANDDLVSLYSTEWLDELRDKLRRGH